MASAPNSANTIFTAIVPYNLSLPHVSVKAYLESVVRRSLESAKYETRRCSPIASNFTERNFVRMTSTSIIPPKSLKTDPRIGIEIFAAATGDEKPPIIIFSHGLGQPGNYRTILDELAEHGYTVLSLTHPSSYEDEDFVTSEQGEAREEELAAVMAKNIQYVLNEIRKGALKIPGDPNRIIIMGHSLGGAASIMVSRSDSAAISGCVNLDGSLHGHAKTGGLKQPLLMMTGDYRELIREREQSLKEDDRKDAKRMNRYKEEYETLRRNSRYSNIVMIEKAGHMDFTDQPLRECLAGEKSLSDAMRVHTIVSREVFKILGLCLSSRSIPK